MTIDNLALDRGLIKSSTVLIGTTEHPIRIGSDVVEALAVAMIHANVNSELQERVRSAMNQVQQNKPNLVYKAETATVPGVPEQTPAISNAAPVVIVGPNAGTADWKRVQVGLQAPVANAGNVYVGISGAVTAAHGWTLTPGDIAQVELPDGAVLHALSVNGTEVLKVWAFGAGTPPALGSLLT